MSRASSHIRCVAILASVALAKAPPAAAAQNEKDERDEKADHANGAGGANEATLNKIVELNKKALVAYDALDMDSASALLHQALNICKRERLENHPAAARTHLHLGVVYISGLKFPELGLAEFGEALAIDPGIRLTKSLLNPEVQEAFENARASEGAPGGTSKYAPFPTGQEPPPAPEQGATPLMDRLNHPLVTRASQGRAIEIKAQVPPGMGAAKVVLAYLAQDGDDFLAREMTPIRDAVGWFHESIPFEATRGAWVAYYIEAKDADDQPVAQNGSPEAPHHVTLVPESAANDIAPGGPAGHAKTRGKAANGRGLWLVVALGSGGGYHRGSPEMNPRDASGARVDVSGFAAAALLHVAPEIGFFQGHNLVLSAQGRFQYVTGTEDVRIGRKTYEPAHLAFAGFAKVTWLVARPRARFQPLLSAMAGAGQIRHSVTTPASANLTGCNASSTCKDTVLGGLALFGVGAGFRYGVGENLGFYAALNLLAGLPHFMVNGDVNIGLVMMR
jgi:hypothetical protein